MAETPTETVTWINVVPFNRREKIAKWWVEEVRQRHTYSSPRQREVDSHTHVPVDMIVQIASDGLKSALLDQKREKEEGSVFMTFPRATPDGSEYFGSISISRGLLKVRFTSHGIEHDDEDN